MMATINNYMNCKYCGVEIKNFGGHSKTCIQYKAYIDKISKPLYNTYIDGENIDSLTKIYNIGRKAVEKILTLNNVDLNSDTHKKHCQQAKHKKLEKTMTSRYGVKNFGQLDNGGYRELNKIPYTKPKFYNKFTIYRKEVGEITKENLKKIIKPVECYITGLTFADTLREKVNPNDWYKRSVDHKKSILECYMDNIDPSIAGGVDNIIFVLKYVNTIKGNMPVDDFKKVYKDKLINILNEN